MKRIVYLTFFFEPDLSACSFRNTPLAKELAEQAKAHDAVVDVYTTVPHRYHSFSVDVEAFEQHGNLRIHRLPLPAHAPGMAGQIKAFGSYYRQVMRINRGTRADLVFASSSRLFTAFLGARVAKVTGAKLYLDIRDIFVDTIEDVLKSHVLKWALMPVLRMIERYTYDSADHINLISGGFRPYFGNTHCKNFSEFTNGIDPVFLEKEKTENHTPVETESPATIVYAGNIGEGQGLHKILPEVAQRLGDGYRFIVVGDGGAKGLLLKAMKERSLSNIILKDPMPRSELMGIYRNATFLFVHLNDYEAFKKVLPSKIFELSTFDRPIIAGVGGYAQTFLREQLPDAMVFDPCDHEAMVGAIKGYDPAQKFDRTAFFGKYSRTGINRRMAASMLGYL